MIVITLSQYKKTVVAVIGAVVSVLAVNNIDVDPSYVVLATTLITAFGVFWFRNE